MIKEAIVEIQSMTKAMTEVKEFEIDGRKYTDKELIRVRHTEISPPSLSVNTLTGFVDYILDCKDECFKPEGSFIHVLDYSTVSLISGTFGDFLQRHTHVAAVTKLLGGGYGFGQAYDVEQFIIALMANFVATDDLKTIIDLVSTIRIHEKEEYKDFGYTQKVTANKGLKVDTSMVEDQNVPNPVILKPYRTFLDVDQPESPFVFRLSSGGEGQPPRCALYEADGGKWKLDAIQIIKTWLKERTEVTIIA